VADGQTDGQNYAASISASRGENKVKWTAERFNIKTIGLCLRDIEGRYFGVPINAGRGKIRNICYVKLIQYDTIQYAKTYRILNKKLVCRPRYTMCCQILDSLGCNSVADSMALPSLSLMQLAPKAALLCKITRNDGHWAVQGHSRSPILVPIESPYATSYYCFRVIGAYWSNYRF